MTTIAADARLGVMVSDSKCTGGGVWYPMTKVFRINGELHGFAGTVLQRQRWIKWAEKGRKGPMPKMDDFSALILRKDGKLYDVSSDGLELEVERGFHAVGSGSHAALGAMFAGADIKTAVEIALQIDTGSGGDICVFNLKDSE